MAKRGVKKAATRRAATKKRVVPKKRPVKKATRSKRTGTVTLTLPPALIEEWEARRKKSGKTKVEWVKYLLNALEKERARRGTKK